MRRISRKSKEALLHFSDPLFCQKLWDLKQQQLVAAVLSQALEHHKEEVKKICFYHAQSIFGH